VDKYLREYKSRRGEPRVMYLARWYHIWPRCQSWVHAYHPWATVAALPFPVSGYSKKHGCRETYEEVIRLYAPNLLHIGGTYRGDKALSYDFIGEYSNLKQGGKPMRRVVADHGETTMQGSVWRRAVDLTPLVDIMYTHSPTLVDGLRKATGCNNVRHLSAGVDTSIYRPVRVKKQIDMLFLGNCGGSKSTRDDVLVKLDRDFDDLWVGGQWVEKLKLRHSFRGAHRLAFNQWTGRARIGLCLVPNHHAKLEMYYPYRLVNTMAVGTFALATYTPGLEKLFTRKVHLDWYTSYEELVELLHYWLEHGKEREQVALQGYRHVLKNFTLRQRAGRILKDVGLLT